MSQTVSARPAAPRSSGPVRFCWESSDRLGRAVTMSLRARECPDVWKAREMIEAVTGCKTWVDGAVQ